MLKTRALVVLQGRPFIVGIVDIVDLKYQLSCCGRPSDVSPKLPDIRRMFA
jgi:hypothetical protein